MPKGPFRTVFSTESDSVVFYYSVVNLLRIVIHYSKYSKSVQNVVIHYIFSSESLCVVISLQIVNSLRVLFLVCRGPLGGAERKIIQKTLFLVGNAVTIKFRKCKFYCRSILLLRRLLNTLARPLLECVIFGEGGLQDTKEYLNQRGT